MPWYHVTITQKSTSAKEVRLDFTLEELWQKVVYPYTKGDTLTLSGKSITPDDIERVKITMTDHDSHYLRQAMEMNPRARMFVTRSAIDSHIANSGGDVTDDFITGPPGYTSERAPKTDPASGTDANKREVFVVRGRNDKARDVLFDFLRAIDLRPLELTDAVPTVGKTLPYIGELLDTAFKRANAVVVLFTPDDEARLREQYRRHSDPDFEVVLSGQARPNVLFEAGMAMGLNKDHTVLVELGWLKPFSDIAGLHVIRLVDSPASRQELAQRLELAGCPVDLKGHDWLTAGDITDALTSMDHGPPGTEVLIELQSADNDIPTLSDEA